MTTTNAQTDSRELVPNRKLVFTDAYKKAWEPSEKPFMTVVLIFEEEGGKTRCDDQLREEWNAQAAVN